MPPQAMGLGSPRPVPRTSRPRDACAATTGWMASTLIVAEQLASAPVLAGGSMPISECRHRNERRAGSGGDAMRKARWSWCDTPTTQWSASSTGPTPKCFLAQLRIRRAEFALELHPAKTCLIEFGCKAASDRAVRGDGKPETFDFLGFTHICSRSRQGKFLLARHTRRDRKMAKLLEISEELRRRWHQDVAEQGAWLGSVVRDSFAYHAVPTNTRALSAFRHHVVDIWRRALRRRSQKDQTTWAMVDKLADRWLPKPRISHPWPAQRFRVKHPRDRVPKRGVRAWLVIALSGGSGRFVSLPQRAS